MFLKNKYIIFGVCMALSAAIAFFIVPTQNKKKAEGEDVVKVTRVIEPNTRITEDMLTVERMLEPPQKLIRSKEEIIGKYSRYTIYPEDNLIMERFTNSDSKNDPRLLDIDGENSFAVSIALKNLSSSLSGKILSGDVISIYGFNTERKEMVIHEDLKYVEVLAVVNNKSVDLDLEEPGENADDSIPAAVTLKVNTEQAGKLIELENTGNIHVVFAGRGETAKR